MRTLNSKWPVIVAFCGCLLWYAVEIFVCLIRTHNFKLLSAPFALAFLVLGGAIVVRIIQWFSSALAAGLALAGLNVCVAALAIWTALTINPSYDFTPPLLRLSFFVYKNSGI